MSALASEPVLEVQGLSKSFPGVRALDNVTLEMRPGRLLALLGANGAGKSTLMEVLSGATTPDTGTLCLDSQAIRFRNVHDAREAGISAIFQELSLAPNLTVAENIYLGCEPRTSLGMLDYRAMNRDAAAHLLRLGVTISPETRLGDLRLGEQQVVEIARATRLRGRVLILDEPTSALSRQESDALLALLVDLKQSGVALIYSTHKFDELKGIADDVVVMRDGRVAGAAPFAQLSHADIVHLMAGAHSTPTQPRTASPATPARPRLRLQNVSLRHEIRGREPILKDINLDVKAGEIVGLFGLVGAGRTELLETLFGLHGRRALGQVFVDGDTVDMRSTMRAIAAGLALAPEDRKHAGLILRMGSRENAGLASLGTATRWGLISPARETARVQPWLEGMRLKASSIDEPVGNLSGGNQQKVVLAKWLVTAPKVLCLDEPTRGIDVHAKAEIYSLVRNLAESGLAVLFASSDTEEILTLSDRIVVLCKGRQAGSFACHDASPETLLRCALGHDPMQYVQ